ncbi:MAG: Na+/H+ antiporter subunit G [Alteromonadaceae bacterium]|nr:Na+/H+ antiporter subunit G [Alteromonadaceae bacterium]
MDQLLQALVALAIIVGAGFTLIGSVGLARLPDFYMRLHAPTKATTLGVGAILFGSVLYTMVTLGSFSLHEILITVFLFFTAPVSAHMMIRSALHLELKQSTATRGKPWPHGRPGER